MLPVLVFFAVAADARVPEKVPGFAGFTVPPLTGLEKKLADDARDGKLDELGLLDAALIASGVKDAEIEEEAKRVRAILAPAIARAKTQRTARARGDVLLRALHETAFRKYSATASEIDDVVRSGEFNCLSSALLFVVAAEGLLDEPRGMVTKHHAFARVKVDGRVADIETTTPGGFDADRKKLMTREYVQKIAGRDASPEELLEDLKRPEELPILSLVAAVYSNRAVGLVKRGELAAAAVALDRGQRLASGALRARLSAWRGGVLNAGAVALVDEGRLDDARALLELALDGAEGETRKLLSGNLANVHLRIADRAMEGGDWTGALAHYDAAARYGAERKDFQSGRSRANAQLAALEGSDARCKGDDREVALCLAALSKALREKGDVERALQQARRAQAMLAEDSHVVRAMFFSLLEKAKAASAKLDCMSVDALIREADRYRSAVQGQPWQPEQFVGNCYARAAKQAFDSKDWVRAASLYTRARAALPDDEALRANIAAADVNQAIEHAKAGRCDDARPLARRAARDEPQFGQRATDLLETCAHVRAQAAAKKSDWKTAIIEARRGLLDAPASETLSNNLGVYLHNQAVAFLREKKCDEARALVPELRLLKRDQTVTNITKLCP